MQGKAKELTKKIGILILTLVTILLCSTIVFLSIPEEKEDKYNKQVAVEDLKNNGEIFTENADFYDRDYWEWHTRNTTDDQTGHNGLHIGIEGNTFQFYGYGVTSYKDFLYKEYERSGQKTFDFVLDENRVNYHTLEGAGFIFNAKIEDYKLTGFVLLLTEQNIELYRLEKVDVNKFETSSNTTMSSFGNKVYSATKPKDVSIHNLRISATGTNISIIDNGIEVMNTSVKRYKHAGESFGIIASYNEHNCSILSQIAFSGLTVVIRDFKIPVKKVNENGRGIEGAEFEVKDKDGRLVADGITDSNGLWNIEGLKPGMYVLKETKAPEGYLLKDEEYPFLVNADNEVLDLETGLDMDFTILNETQKIEFTKYVRNTTIPVSGAKFVLLDSNKDQAYNLSEEPCQAISDADGKVIFRGIQTGTYYIKETQAPKGYALDETLHRCVVNIDGTVDYTDMKDQIIYNDRLVDIVPDFVVVNKYEENSTVPVPGVTIGFYEENGSRLLGDNGEWIELTTDENGKVDLSTAVSALKEGTYKYAETSAPVGYEYTSKTYEFELKAPKTVVFKNDDANITTYGILYNKVITVDVQVTKVWDDENNKENGRPSSIILKVLGDGVETERFEVGESDGWTHTFTVRKFSKEGQLIEYTVDEAAVNENDLIFYEKEIDGHTITNTYKIPEEATYKVQHYKQNETGDGYDLEEEEELVGKTLSIVTAQPKEYNGYIINRKVPGTKEKGVVEIDGSLVLKLYYDKQTETEFEIRLLNLEKNTSMPIQGSKYDIKIKYEDGTEKEYRKEITDEIGSIKIKNVPGKNIMKVYIKQIEVPEEYSLDDKEKYVEIKINAEGNIEKTGAGSKEIITNVAKKVLSIKHFNEILKPKNILRINAVDEEDNDIKIGNVKFQVTFPDGSKNEVETEEGEAEITDIPVPGEGIYTYEIRQLNAAEGYENKETPVYISITFDKLGRITNTERIDGDVTTEFEVEKEKTVENRIAIANILQKRTEEGPFGEYKIKVIERDKDTKAPVAGVTDYISQTGNGQSLSATKTTDASGEALSGTIKTDEIVIKVKRTGVPGGYVLFPDEIEVTVTKDSSGNYKMKNSIRGVSIDTENKVIIIERELFKGSSETNLSKTRINNTIYITKVDEEGNLIGNVELQLREESSGKKWDLLTNENGEAKLLIPTEKSEYPEHFIEQAGKLKFWITERKVPVGFENIDEDIGFEMEYARNPEGGLEIVGVSLIDGLSYFHIQNQEFDQREMDTYTQVDMRLEVINNYGDGREHTLELEKVDEQDSIIKLEDASFEVTLSYSNGETTVKNTITTDIKGLAYLQKLRFPEGVTEIELKEVAAPTHYALDKTPTKIIVTNRGGTISTSLGTYDAEKNVLKVQLTNALDTRPYELQIRKRELFTSEAIVKTAKFDVTITDSTGENTQTLSTTQGIAKLSDLNSKGEIQIKIKETKAPIGYKLNEDTITVNLTKESLTKEVVLQGNQEGVSLEDNIVYVDVYDEPSDDVLLQIRKVDSVNTELGLAGASFKVTNPKNIEKQVTTLETGEIDIEIEEPISGRYIIEEIKAPEEYAKGKKVAIDITFNENGEIASKELVTGLGEEYADEIVGLDLENNKLVITIGNEKVGAPYTLQINKISSGAKQAIDGVTFDIKISGESPHVETKTTAEGKGIELTELVGKGDIVFDIQEVDTPEGYIGNPVLKGFKVTRDETTNEIVLDENTLMNLQLSNVEIDNENQVIKVTIENDPKEALLTILNEDIDDNTKKIEGTTFNVTATNVDVTGVTDKMGLTEQMKIGGGKNTTVSYLIKTTSMNNKEYSKNDDVTLQIEYDEEGKIQSAVITGGEYDSQGRKVAEIDTNVDYEGNKEIQIIIRCENEPENNLILINEDIDDHSIKLSGTKFEVKVEENLIGEGTTNAQGKTEEISLGTEKNKTVVYTINITDIKEPNYGKVKNVEIEVVYDETGRIQSAQVIKGEKDKNERIVAEIDTSVDYTTENKLQIIIRCKKFGAPKIRIVNLDKYDESIPIEGTTFEVEKVEYTHGTPIEEGAAGKVGEGTTDATGTTRILLGTEASAETDKYVDVRYKVKNIGMKNKDYIPNNDFEVILSFNTEGIIQGVQMSGSDFAWFISTEIDWGSNEMPLKVLCKRKPHIIIENEDIDENDIKIEGTTFDIQKIGISEGKGTTNGEGLTDAINIMSEKSATINYIIKNTSMKDKEYIKNKDVTLQIIYDEKGNIQSSEIIRGGTDDQGRIVAEIEQNENPENKEKIHIKIRCEKEGNVKLKLINVDKEDNSILIPGTTFQVEKSGKIVGKGTTDNKGEMTISLKPEKNKEVIYTIKNIQMTNKEYEKNKDFQISIEYDGQGKIIGVEIVNRSS